MCWRCLFIRFHSRGFSLQWWRTATTTTLTTFDCENTTRRTPRLATGTHDTRSSSVYFFIQTRSLSPPRRCRYVLTRLTLSHSLLIFIGIFLFHSTVLSPLYSPFHLRSRTLSRSVCTWALLVNLCMFA